MFRVATCADLRDAQHLSLKKENEGGRRQQTECAGLGPSEVSVQQHELREFFAGAPALHGCFSVERHVVKRRGEFSHPAQELAIFKGNDDLSRAPSR